MEINWRKRLRKATVLGGGPPFAFILWTSSLAGLMQLFAQQMLLMQVFIHFLRKWAPVGAAQRIAGDLS